MDIKSFWTKGYAGQIPNSGHELALYVLWLLKNYFGKSAYFMIFFLSSISYRPTDLFLLEC